MRLVSTALALAFATTGCVARFDGEIDNKTIPTFGSAAFGSTTTRSFFGLGSRVHIVMGFLGAGDSCADGADLMKAERRLAAAGGDERQDRAEKVAEIMNERFADDSWYGRLTITAPDDDDLDDTEVDIGRPDNDDVVIQSLVMCQRSGEVNAVDGQVQSDDDCYRAADGDVDITRSGDEAAITLVSERGVDFVDENGRDEGEVGFTMTLSECEDLDDEVEALFPAG